MVGWRFENSLDMLLGPLGQRREPSSMGAHSKSSWTYKSSDAWLLRMRIEGLIISADHQLFGTLP